MIEQILIETIISKALELAFKKVNSFNRRFNENQTFDLLCERLLIEYKEKNGEDILFEKFFNEGNDRVMGLKNIIDKKALTRELFRDILLYISEQTGASENDSRIKDFATMLISEFMFIDEFRDKMFEYRRDVESGETNTIVKEIIKMLYEIKEEADRYYNKTSDDDVRLHQLTNPPPKGNELLHRDSTVSDLQKLIENDKNIVLVNGLGGIGKTSIARKVYHNIKDQYKHIAWIEYQESLKRSLLSSLYIFDSIKDESIRYKLIEQFLANSKSDTILFIDNVNNTVSDDPSLSVLLGICARVVMTSRRSNNMQDFTPIHIGFLCPEQCIDVFYEYYKFDKSRAQIETVKKLVKLVSCHTLSVELLAKSANVPGYDLLEYLYDLIRYGFGYPDLLIETNHSKQAKTIAQHLITLFEFVNVSEEQKRILKNFAILPSMEIPTDIRKWIECKNGDLMRLNELGWISVTENSYIMPDIVKESIRMQINTISINDYMKLIENMSKNDYIKGTDDYITALVRLKIAEAVIDEFKNEKTEIMGDLLNNIAVSHLNQGEYDKALEYSKMALSICEEVLGKDYTSTATIYNNMGLVYFRQGDYPKALELNHKALTINEKVLGKEHPDTATTYNNIALVYIRQGEYPKAFEWCHKALNIREKVMGKEHPDTATTYNDIASVYYSQGDYAKALEWYHKALNIYEKELGKEHTATSTKYNNIALVYWHKGEYAKAFEWIHMVLYIREKVLGKEHPDTATTYHDIASVYYSQGDYANALEWYHKALAIHEKVLGKEHPLNAATYNNIALVYIRQGEYNKALEWCHKALNICEKVLGKEHPDTADTYNDIALVYWHQGEYAKALEWNHMALNIYEKVLGKEHPSTATAYNNIAIVYHSKGEYHKALEWYHKAVITREKLLGKEHPDTATTYNNIAGVYHRQGDYAKALEWYLNACYVFIKVLGLEHPNTQTVLNNTYSAYVESGKDESGFEDWMKERFDGGI